MELPTGSDFWQIASLVISALGLFLALRASARREARSLRADMEKIRVETKALREHIDEGIRNIRAEIQALREHVEKLAGDARADTQALREHVDKGAGNTRAETKALREHIDRLEERLGGRIDRLEKHAREDHRELSAGLAALKAEVSALGAKLDERSRPRRLQLETVREETHEAYSGECPDDHALATDDSGPDTEGESGGGGNAGSS